jgi:hypothetical protein
MATAAESFEQQGSRKHWHDVLDTIFDSGDLLIIDTVRLELTIYVEMAVASQGGCRAATRAPGPVPPGAVDISTRGRR